MFTPLGSKERFPVHGSPTLFCSEFSLVGTVRWLAPGCQRCKSSLQFQFATTEVFVLVGLSLIGVLPPFFSTLGSRIGSTWSYVEGAVYLFIGLVQTTYTKPRTMLSVEDAKFLTFLFVEKVSHGVK
ncbi:MAG: hypothetical protein EZS28_030432 [Streblomastix strix]|uniref:Uncharacterized protein n=1 Tax=Streblomastix strix TaxID=222440 RepID=A0A5J4UV50_9EUKA|nr:MAG: hypothetical protein EZS28_030432 [Streblomastix strix]